MSTFGQELPEKNIARPRSDRNAAFFVTSAIATSYPTLQHAAYNRLARIGGVKLAWLE